MKKKKRILLGIGEIAGYYTNLKKGLDELGAKSYYFSIDAHPFKYGQEGKKENAYMSSVRYFLSKKMSAKKNKSVWEIWWTIWLVLFIFPLRLSIFIWSLIWCDVFVFHGTSSFFHGTSSFFEMYDLPILKLFGKRIIWIFHGSDTRPAYISGSSVSADFGCSIEKCLRIAKKQKKWVSKIERYADVIVNHPPSSHFHEKKFIQYLALGIPFSCSYTVKDRNKPVSNHEKCRVVHAPSFSECKGSSRFRDIMRVMREKGYFFEYIEIVGRPNSEVLMELADCDFVIDELYSDTTMAGLATEAAFFGKPSVVGGYATNEDMGKLDVQFIPPSEYHHPDGIEDAIEKLLTDTQYRIELGKNAGEFVRRNWAPEKVAERFLRIVNDDFPEEWLFDPHDIRYIHGWGLSEQDGRNLIVKFLEYAGKDGLCLSDKPELEKKFIEFSMQ
jgi:glycosyltransferase involved in cell wall biosynthesis